MPRVLASLALACVVGWAWSAASLLSLVAAPVPPPRAFRPRPPLPGAYVALWSGAEWPTLLLEGGDYIAERPGLLYHGTWALKGDTLTIRERRVTAGWVGEYTSYTFTLQPGKLQTADGAFRLVPAAR